MHLDRENCSAAQDRNNGPPGGSLTRPVGLPFAHLRVFGGSAPILVPRRIVESMPRTQQPRLHGLEWKDSEQDGYKSKQDHYRLGFPYLN